MKSGTKMHHKRVCILCIKCCLKVIGVNMFIYLCLFTYNIVVPYKYMYFVNFRGRILVIRNTSVMEGVQSTCCVWCLGTCFLCDVLVKNCDILITG